MVCTVPALTLALMSPTFDADTTTMALKHAEGRPAALRQILALPPPEVERAQAADLAPAVGRVLDNPTLPAGHRVLAARALVVLGEGHKVLTRQLNRGGRRRAATPEAIVVARACTLSLRQLGGAEAQAGLGAALSHQDPEVRATAAASGVQPDRLCALVQSDRWPRVRVGAAQGLAHHPEASVCLSAALTDEASAVQVAAARTLAKTRPEGARDALVQLAANPRAPLPARAEALTALGALKVVGPARQVMRTHLKSGEIVPLALGAVRALVLAGTPEAIDELEAALASQAAAVQIRAAQGLAERAPERALPLLEALRARVSPHKKPELERIIERLKPAEGDDVEDEEDAFEAAAEAEGSAL